MQEKIKFDSPGGVQLAGIFHQPTDRPNKGVVICHGLMSYKDSPKHEGIATALEEHKIASLRFDFSGRGESDGDLSELTFSRQIEECQAAVNYLKGKGVSKVGLVGSSMGGAVSILVTSLGGINCLATMAAVGRADLLPQRAVGPEELVSWKKNGFLHLQGEKVGYSLVENSKDVDVLKAAEKVTCPWLIIHGQKDEVIPTSDAEGLYKASRNQAKLEFIAGADHQFSDDEDRKKLTNMIVEFLVHNL
jgi:esterase/lipase